MQDAIGAVDARGDCGGIVRRGAQPAEELLPFDQRAQLRLVVGEGGREQSQLRVGHAAMVHELPRDRPAERTAALGAIDLEQAGDRGVVERLGPVQVRAQRREPVVLQVPIRVRPRERLGLRT